MQEEPISNGLLSFNCHQCEDKAHMPVLTPCGHLFWYVQCYSAGDVSASSRRSRTLVQSAPA